MFQSSGVLHKLKQGCISWPAPRITVMIGHSQLPFRCRNGLPRQHQLPFSSGWLLVLPYWTFSLPEGCTCALAASYSLTRHICHINTNDTPAGETNSMCYWQKRNFCVLCCVHPGPKSCVGCLQATELLGTSAYQSRPAGIFN